MKHPSRFTHHAPRLDSPDFFTSHGAYALHDKTLNSSIYSSSLHWTSLDSQSTSRK
jgi:hypothetical protein